MEKMGTYRTSDIYIASYMLSKGLQLEGIDRNNSQRCDFIFIDRKIDLIWCVLLCAAKLREIFLISFIISKGQSGCCTRSRSRWISPKKPKPRLAARGKGKEE